MKLLKQMTHKTPVDTRANGHLKRGHTNNATYLPGHGMGLTQCSDSDGGEQNWSAGYKEEIE